MLDGKKVKAVGGSNSEMGEDEGNSRKILIIIWLKTPHSPVPSEAGPERARGGAGSGGRPVEKAEALVFPHSVTVEKRGLGSVTLQWGDAGFSVACPGAEPRSFASLSSACDHVWVVQKGFESVDDFRKKTGRRKVPSGAGWKFWGITERVSHAVA